MHLRTRKKKKIRSSLLTLRIIDDGYARKLPVKTIFARRGRKNRCRPKFVLEKFIVFMCDVDIRYVCDVKVIFKIKTILVDVSINDKLHLSEARQKEIHNYPLL